MMTLRNDKCFSDHEKYCLNPFFEEAIMKLKLVKHILNHEIDVLATDQEFKMKNESSRKITIPLENYVKAANKR